MITIIVYLIGVVLNVAMTIPMYKDLKQYWGSNSHMAWIYANCLLSVLSFIPAMVCFSIWLDDRKEERNRVVNISEHQQLVNKIISK